MCMDTLRYMFDSPHRFMQTRCNKNKRQIPFTILKKIISELHTTSNVSINNILWDKILSLTLMYYRKEYMT